MENIEGTELQNERFHEALSQADILPFVLNATTHIVKDIGWDSEGTYIDETWK